MNQRGKTGQPKQLPGLVRHSVSDDTKWPSDCNPSVQRKSEKNFMKAFKAQNYKMAPAALALMAIFLSACGAEAVREPVTANSTTTQSQSSNNVNFPTGTYSPTPTPTSGGGSLPPITASFTLTGSGGTSPTYSTTVDTDSLLKIKVIAGASTNVIPGSNFSATYGCVTYKVTALGQSQVTSTLSVGGNSNPICPNAPSEQVLDFSSRLTAGHRSVQVTVEATGYDFYCQGCLTYPWLYAAYPYGPYSCSMYCPMHTVYKNHGVTGSMAIQVNGTYL